MGVDARFYRRSFVLKLEELRRGPPDWKPDVGKEGSRGIPIRIDWSRRTAVAFVNQALERFERMGYEPIPGYSINYLGKPRIGCFIITHSASSIQAAAEGDGVFVATEIPVVRSDADGVFWFPAECFRRIGSEDVPRR